MILTQNMTFKKYGRSLHLNIENAADLKKAVALDAVHWVATSAPLATINFDRTFLKMLDSDNKGRITCSEVKDAINWLLEVLRDTDSINKRRKTLSLSAINTDSAAGQKTHAAAKKIVRIMNRPQAPDITLHEIRQIKTQIETTPVSETGVVLPQAVEDAQISQFITDVVNTIGGAEHPGGALGINETKLQQFVLQADTYLRWYNKGKISPRSKKTDIMPLGPATTNAYEIFAHLQDKIEQYFAQCRMLKLDAAFAQRIGFTDSKLKDLDFDDAAVLEKVLQDAPLATPKATEVLNLTAKINPYYAEKIKQFRREVIRPVLKKTDNTFSLQQWEKIKAFFSPCQNWLAEKPDTNVDTLGPDLLKKYLNQNFADTVRNLIYAGKNTALALESVHLIEKLILYQAHMIDFANNFVSFPHLYDPNQRAMFEMGSLVMDGRRFNLAVKADNRARHVEVAQTSNMFVLYVEITPRDNTENYEVALPVTAGDKGNLCLGKRGVFHNIHNNECDAKVVHIIENPISFREALVSPFQRLGRLLFGKIESIAVVAEKKLDTKASTALDRLTAPPAVTPAAAPAGKQNLAASTGGLLIGAGVAMAALGSAAAYIVKTLAGIHYWQIILALAAAVLLVMLPLLTVAFLKLRKRDLSDILEGAGWAVNARMRLTHKLGRFFTERPKYPN